MHNFAHFCFILDKICLLIFQAQRCVSAIFQTFCKSESTPPHGGGPAEAAGQGGFREDRGGGGDRLLPPAQQGLYDPHGIEKELKL